VSTNSHDNLYFNWYDYHNDNLYLVNFLELRLLCFFCEMLIVCAELFSLWYFFVLVLCHMVIQEEIQN
jgi:hypothetical protein